MTLEVLTTGNKSEKIKTLPVTLGSDPHQPKVVYSLMLTNIKKGDAIQFVARGEVTNDLTYNVMIASKIVLTISEDDPYGAELIEAAGTNLNPERHHHVLNDVGIYQFKSDYPIVFINAVWYSASTKARLGATLKVEQDYGALQLMLWRV